WMETAKKYEAKELDPNFADKYASDYTGIATATGQSLSWGVCNIWPIKRIPEIYNDLETLLLKYEGIMKDDGGKKLWSIVAVGGVKHPMCDFCYGFTADRSDSKIRAKAFAALQELQKMAIEHGAPFYDLGRLPAAAYLWEKARPAHIFLKTIKKTLDPNDIMNPGSLML
ncbi:MAG: FAD-linked oxidase C-terminal domain-containing protein, partial [Fervidobacterium sp.]